MAHERVESVLLIACPENSPTGLLPPRHAALELPAGRPLDPLAPRRQPPLMASPDVPLSRVVDQPEVLKAREEL